MSENPHSDFIGLCQAIGYVVVHTALIEQQLDSWVNVSFNNCGGASLAGDQMVPRALARKISFLNRAFRELPPLHPYAVTGRALLRRTKPLFDTRHDLVHGTITSLTPIDGAFHFRVIGHLKEHHTIRRFMFDPTHFAELEKELSALLTDVIALSQTLVDRFLKSQR